MLSLAGRIQVCSHWLAGYKYALIGWQNTSMLSLAGSIQVCSHWLEGYKYTPIGWQDTSMLSLAERTFVSWISFADWKHSKLLLAGRFSRKLLLASRTVGSRDSKLAHFDWHFNWQDTHTSRAYSSVGCLPWLSLAARKMSALWVA
jgi:hypothetical protein